MKYMMYCKKCFEDSSGYIKTIKEILEWSEEYIKNNDTIGFYSCKTDNEFCKHHPKEKLQKMNLSYDEFNNIASVSNDKSFILAMDSLKEKDPIEFQLKMSQFKTQVQQQESIKAQNDNIPRCPHCKSTNIKSISGLNRGASIAMLGIFSKKINKSFECKQCGYTW